MKGIKLMNKYKILALYGKGGTGKDTIQKWLVSNNKDFNGIISYTTRPIRDNEKDGIDYYFIDNEEFAKKVLNGSMLEATEFNGWFYGTGLESLVLDEINVGVFNMEGIECLMQDDRLDIIPVEIYAPAKTRLERMISREENPNCSEICRRFLSDEKDFDSELYDEISCEGTVFANIGSDDHFNILNLYPIKEWIEDFRYLQEALAYTD